MIKRKTMYFLAAAATAGVVGLAAQSFAAHPVQDAACPTCPPGGNIDLIGDDGSVIKNNLPSSVPYSPKQTCGATGCHDVDYENSWTTATKTQWNRDHVDQFGNPASVISYDVPYPEHGVSAGYHFQQGRNIDWDETQRSAYGLPEFTSSAGMYGKY